MNPFERALRKAASQLAGDLVSAAFDSAKEVLARSETPSEPGGSQPPPVSADLPAGAHMSRERCPDCGGPRFFVRLQDGDGDCVKYFCRQRGCRIDHVLRSEAANREGRAP